MPKRTFDKISKRKSEECFTIDGSTSASKKLIVYVCKMQITQLNRWRPMLRHEETPKLYFEGYVLSSRDSGKKRRYVTCKTDPLDIRLSCSLFKLRNGDIYSLVGELFDPENSIPPSVKTKFRNGIPKKWQSVIKYWDNIKNYSPWKKPLRSFSSSCAWLESLKDSGQVKVSSRGRIIIPSPKLLKGEKLSPQLIKRVHLISKHLKSFRTNLGPLFNKTIEEKKPSSTEDIKPEFDAVTGTSCSPDSELSGSEDRALLKNSSTIEVNKCRKVFGVQNNRNLVKERILSNVNQRIISAFKHHKVPANVNNNVYRNEKSTKNAYEKVTKQKYSRYNLNKPKYQLRSSSGTRLSQKKCPCCEKEEKVSVNNISSEHVKGESASYSECEDVMTAVLKIEHCTDLLTKENALSTKKPKEYRDMQKLPLEKTHLPLTSIKSETNLNVCTVGIQKTNLPVLSELSQGRMQPSSSGPKTINGEAAYKLRQKMLEKKSETVQKSNNKPGPDISNNNFLTSTPTSCVKRSEKKNDGLRKSAQEKTPSKTVISCSNKTDDENDRFSGKGMSPGPTEEQCVKLSASERQTEERKSTVTDSLNDKKDYKAADKSRSEKKNVRCQGPRKEKKPSRNINSASCSADARNKKVIGKSISPVHAEDMDSHVKRKLSEKQVEDRKSTVADKLGDKKDARVVNEAGSEKKNIGGRGSAKEKRPSRKISNGCYSTKIKNDPKVRNDRSSDKYVSPVQTDKKETRIKQPPSQRKSEDKKHAVSNKLNNSKENIVAGRSGGKSVRSSKSKGVTKLTLTGRAAEGKVRGQVFPSKKKSKNEASSDSGEENIDSSLLSEENVRKLERRAEENKPRLSLNEIDDLLDTGAPRTLKKRKQLKKIMDSYSSQNAGNDLFTDPDYNYLIDESTYSSQEWDVDYDVAVRKIVSGNSYDQLSLGSTPPAIYVPEFVNDDNISVRSKSPFERTPCDENDTLRYVHRVLKEKNVPTKRKSLSNEFGFSVSPTKIDSLTEENEAYKAFKEGKPIPAKLFDLKHRKKNSSSDDSSSDTSED